jgi:Rrf2 family cysteine metabolism transcriptional repressor
MKLSTRGEYGLRAMFELALHYGKGPIPLKFIAQKQELSEHYLEQLFASLRKSGLVESTRGSQGGYNLAKKPEEILVGDIIRALEGPIGPTDCVKDKGKLKPCERADTCVARSVWEKVRDSITEVLDSITLAQMCEQAKKQEEF